MTPDLTPAKISPVSERQSSAWDIRNAPRNYLTLVVTQIGSAAFSFVAVWIITRYLGSEGYGGIVAVIAASQVAQVLVNWTSIAVVRFGVDEFIETERIVRTFWIRFIVLAVNIVLVLALAAFWFPPLAAWLKLSPETIWLVLAHFSVTAVWIHIQMSLQGVKMLRTQGVLQMLERVLIVAGLAALVAAKSLTGPAAMLCYIIAPAVMIAAGVVLLRPFIFARFTPDRAFVRKIFTYSLPLLPFTLVGYFSGTYADAIFVTHFLSTRDLGIYAVATQINGIALQLPTLANTLLLPLFVTLHKESDQMRGSQYFRDVLPGTTLLWGLLCSALSFVSYFLIPWTFGGEFSRSTFPLWILLTASVVAVPVALGFSAMSNAISATYIPMYAAIFSAGINVIGNMILIPMFGIAGAAWATLAAYSASVIIFAVLLGRRDRVPISWVPAALVPSLSGTAAYAYVGDPAIAIAVCLSLTLFVAYLFRSSINRAALFLQGLRAPKSL